MNLYIIHILIIMGVVRAVLNETLRLFPSAPLIARMSRDIPLTIPTTDNEVLYLPPHTQVMMVSLLLHRRHDLWGYSADEFRPERWLDEENLNKISGIPFMYCPFSGGPRIVECHTISATACLIID